MVKMYSPAIARENRKPGLPGLWPASNKKGAPAGAPSMMHGGAVLAEILVGDLGQIEHGHLASPAEEWTKLLVRIDGPAVLGVLQTVPLDVRPELTDDLSPRHGAVTDHGSQFGAGLQRLHERGIGCAPAAR